LTPLLRTAGLAFLDGLIRPSLLAVSIAAALCLGTIELATLLIDATAMSGEDSALFALDPLDDYAFATSDALRLLHAPPQGRHVALIGTAAMREALTVGDDIAARLSHRLDQTVPVIDFMSGGQSGIEMAALADSLGDDFEGVLVLGISFSRLAADNAELASLVREPRLAFASAAGDAEIRAAGFTPPPRTGLYLLDHYKFFVARYRAIVWHLLTGTRPVHRDRTYLGRAPASPAQWAADAATLTARLSHYQNRADSNLGALDRLIRRFPDRAKVRIVLLEIPLNPLARDTVIGPAFVEAHRARMEDFARRNGVDYWDLNQTAGLVPEDFQDWAHVSSVGGRDRWTADLIDRLGLLLSSPSRMP
jgi:hypothetical protein